MNLSFDCDFACINCKSMKFVITNTNYNYVLKCKNCGLVAETGAKSYDKFR